MGVETRKINERFFEEYTYFNKVLCEHFGVEDHGVTEYLKRMKECVVEAREVIPEWDSTFQRMVRVKKRSDNLKTKETTFDDFQGKDEDVVWMSVFIEKLEAKADPLSKYATMNFKYKCRRKSLWQRILGLFK